MDVSYSAWRQLTEERLTLKGESFSFLFDRRYTNRLNRMSRVFFEAYARATKELAAQEDRFPSLSEIDAKMESGAVYAFKDRLTKNTEFFEEVKISGVSYLVPRAKMFVDSSGLYTELSFNFEEGTVILPTRRKVPVTAGEASLGSENADTVQRAETDIVDEIIDEGEEQAHEVEARTSSPEEAPSGIKEQIACVQQGVPAYPGHIPETFGDVVKEASTLAGNDKPTASDSCTLEAASASSGAKPEAKRPEHLSRGTFTASKIKFAAFGLIAIIIIVAAGVYLSSPVPIGSPKFVYYSSILSNSSQGYFLSLDIENKNALGNEVEMMLPLDIDKSISSRGGVITISHAGNTSIRLNSSSDSSVRMYLARNLTSVPVTLSMVVPKGYDSELVVHGKDYDVKRKDDRIILRFNCTQEGVSFEQSYSPKR